MTIILYTRPGCHLCVRAKETLEIAQDRFAFAIVERNIDENPAWKESFGEDIPGGSHRWQKSVSSRRPRKAPARILGSGCRALTLRHTATLSPTESPTESPTGLPTGSPVFDSGRHSTPRPTLEVWRFGTNHFLGEEICSNHFDLLILDVQSHDAPRMIHRQDPTPNRR